VIDLLCHMLPGIDDGAQDLDQALEMARIALDDGITLTVCTPHIYQGRCWGILEQHWNGTKLSDAETMFQWAKTMTWKSLHPVVELSCTIYEKGVRLTKEAMQAVDARLLRNPQLPKWDILISPACPV
jgi:hypothetical protein